MAKRTKSSRPQRTEDAVSSTDVDSRSNGDETAQRPRRNLPLLIASGSLYLVWFLFLLYVALFQ